jgi:hypothetical protein
MNYRLVEPGQFSLFEDPDGRVLGMWKQPK